MPELPEVEVVRLGIQDHVVGRTITGVTVFDMRSVRRHLAGPADFISRVEGRSVGGVARRGKYLWMKLDHDDAVLCHLGMSGQFLIANAEIAHIARDPLDPLFDPLEFAKRLRKRETGVKRAILDQTLISGVGNIYADEALWRTPLHYARNTKHLKTREVEALLSNITQVMHEALKQGGTSFDALYVNVNGTSGYFDRSLQAYAQEGKPCQRCGTPMRRDAFMNRSSYWCPTCQARPRNGKF